MNPPLELVYWETKPEKKAAKKRELQLKKFPHNKKLKLIKGWKENMDLPEQFQKYEYFIIAPGRVNLLGEHVDYNGGPVLPAAINRYVMIGADFQKDNLVSLNALDLNEEITFPIDNITAKVDQASKQLPQWALYPAGVLWAANEKGLNIKGFKATFSSNIPIGSGLSSSAAVEVGFAALVRELCDWRIDNIELAKLCQVAENKYVGVNCGIMDQFASANGVENAVIYLNTNDLTFETVPLPEEVSIIIADSKKRRSLSGSEYNERRKSCEEAVTILRKFLPDINFLNDVSIEDLEKYGNSLSEIAFKRAKHVINECNRVNQALFSLKNDDIGKFGSLMIEGHESLRDLYQVSIPELDFLVSTAIQTEGCYGSRLTGAGFGGCTVSIVKNINCEEFINHLKSEYFRVYGIHADIYICQASQGVSVEWRKK
jgi:galactokinase